MRPGQSHTDCLVTVIPALITIIPALITVIPAQAGIQ